MRKLGYVHKIIPPHNLVDTVESVYSGHLGTIQQCPDYSGVLNNQDTGWSVGPVVVCMFAPVGKNGFVNYCEDKLKIK